MAGMNLPLPPSDAYESNEGDTDRDPSVTPGREAQLGCTHLRLSLTEKLVCHRDPLETVLTGAYRRGVRAANRFLLPPLDTGPPDDADLPGDTGNVTGPAAKRNKVLPHRRGKLRDMTGTCPEKPCREPECGSQFGKNR
ncbi:hypothetical protein AA21291_2420 [Swaminathania salitolerans LMG 21291]|nr:hypothetical protein AA21291_2420 [Swaminathania salitolerans LMG 21291]